MISDERELLFWKRTHLFAAPTLLVVKLYYDSGTITPIHSTRPFNKCLHSNLKINPELPVHSERFRSCHVLHVDKTHVNTIPNTPIIGVFGIHSRSLKVGTAVQNIFSLLKKGTNAYPKRPSEKTLPTPLLGMRK